MDIEMKHRRLLSIAYIALGIGAAASSLLGPLAFDIIDWRISGNMEHQILGGDIVILGLVAPSLMASGVLWWRGHRLAPVLALGPTIFGVYTWPTYVLVPEYDRYAGNNELLIPLYIALTTISWATATIAWSALDTSRLPVVPRRLSWAIAGTLLLLGGVIALTWARQIGVVLSGDTSLAEYQEHPTGFWLIKTFDLGFVIPLQIATAIGLLRRHPLAIKATYAFSAFLVLLTGSVAGMGVVMLVRDDPSATIALPAITSVMTLLLAWLTARLIRVYLRPDTPPAQPTRRSAGQMRPRMRTPAS